MVDLNVVIIGLLGYAGLAPILVIWYLPKILLDKMKRALAEEFDKRIGIGKWILDQYTAKPPLIIYAFYLIELIAPILVVVWGEIWLQPLFVSIDITYSIGMILAVSIVMLFFSLLFIRNERILREMIVIKA